MLVGQGLLLLKKAAGHAQKCCCFAGKCWWQLIKILLARCVLWTTAQIYKKKVFFCNEDSELFSVRS